MLLGDLCTYVIINIFNITVYLMLLLLTVFRIKDMFQKHLKNVFFFVRALVIINFGINFHFYTRHVYRFKISVIGLLDL